MISEGNYAVVSRIMASNGEKVKPAYNRVVLLNHSPKKHEEDYIFACTIKSAGLNDDEFKMLQLNKRERNRKRILEIYSEEKYFQILCKIEKGKSRCNR